MNPLWSLVLAALGIVSMILAGYKKKSAWVVGLVSQVVWMTYGIATRQWGFILSAGVFSVVYGRNLWLWHRDDKREVSE